MLPDRLAPYHDAKIPYHRHAGMGRYLVVIPDLQRIRRFASGFMPYRLPMTTDSDNIRRLHILLTHKGQHGIGK